MTTPPPAPKVVKSGAIDHGAYLLISLIEDEKAKATASIQQELNTLRKQFRAATAESTRQSQDAQKNTKLVQERLVDVLVRLTKVNTEVEDARRQAGQAKADLEQIKNMFGKVGIVIGADNAIELQGELAAMLTLREDKGLLGNADTNHEDRPRSPLPVDPIHIVERLRKMLEANRNEIAYWRDKYHALEKEQKEALKNIDIAPSSQT